MSYLALIHFHFADTMRRMACKGLADYLEVLSARGDLARVAVPVDADLEIAEITRRVANSGGPALLFEKVGSGSLAIATNLLGTTRRACAALGIDALDDLPDRLESAIAEHTPQNWFDRLKLAGTDSGLEKLRPKPIKQAPCQQVVHLGRDVELAAFPFVRAGQQETAPSVTAGLCVTESLQSQQRGVTRLPLVVLDTNRLVAQDDGNSALARHFREYQAHGERLPAAIVLGGDPALLPLSDLALPPSVDLWHLAGILRGRPLDVIKCRTHELVVPADAELILEGYFDPDAADEIGVVFHVAAITQRTRAILPAIIDTGTHGDLATLVKVRERALLTQLRTLNPNIRDFCLPAVGGPHAFAVVSLASASAGLVRQVAAAVWGSDALRFTRFLAIVDADINVHAPSHVLSAIGANVAPERDVFMFDGPAYSGDLEVASAQLSRRIGIDATSKGGLHATSRAAAGEEALRLVTARWAEYGLS